ncbi:MAG: YibE/F family protein [Anaerovoracaceae bacterium]
MTMTIALLLVFIFLTLLIGGDKAAKALITLGQNAVVLAFTIVAIDFGVHPILATTVSCVLISLITLFYQNEVNQKTIAAFISVIFVIGLMSFSIYLLTFRGNLQGFPTGQYSISKSNGYMDNIGINMAYLQISVILMLLIGAALDTALAVTSALFEVHTHSSKLTLSELFYSGINIGKDILSSTINTLFFIFIGEYLTMFLQFMNYYSFGHMINSKEFAQEVISIALGGIGCVIIIPVAALIGSYTFKSHCKLLNKKV